MRVKVCCIASEHEVDLAVRHGAHALGFVGEMRTGPGVLDDAVIRRLARYAGPFVSTVLLSNRTTAAALIQQCRDTTCTTLQIVGHVEPSVHEELARVLPHVKLLQVVHVEDDGALEQARDYAPRVDAILLDSGSPSKGVLGGTGKTHDWEISARIVEQLDGPVILAGGLRADNVARAIAQVRPHAVDLCTGVRTDGDLDETRLSDFMAQVRQSA